MSTLEDLLPEMAGVFAAQESALANCVDVLTTQLHNLALDHNRTSSRVAALESSHQQLLDVIAALQTQNQQLQQQQLAQIQEMDTLRHHQETMMNTPTATVPDVDVAGIQRAMAEELQSHAAQLVTSVVTTQLAEMETKLTAQLNEKLLESTSRAFLRAQQSEETVQSQLEMLEKRFDYLSKIKMEIKELGRRMERQDQTLDDMRTGLSLLAKSVGTDEIDDEEEADAQAEAEENDAWRRGQREEELLDEKDVKASGRLGTPMPVAVAVAVAVVEKDEADAMSGRMVEEEKMDTAEETVEAVVEEPLAEEMEAPPEILPVEDVTAEDEPQQQPQPEDTTATPLPQPPAVDSEPEISVRAKSRPPSAQPESETPPPSTREVMSEPEPVDPIESPATQDDDSAAPPAPEPKTETPRPASPQETTDVAVVVPDLSLPSPHDDFVERVVDDELLPDGEELPALEEDTFSSPMPTTPTTTMVSSFTPHHSSHLQHMPTAPSLSTVAYIRSRRQERTAKRGSRRESSLELSSTPSSSDPSSARQQLQLPTRTPPPPRIPLSFAEIKVLWGRVFTKIIQLRRLQAINGTSPERTLFRKQHISMGARVRRLEEASTDLEDTVELLEASIHSNTQTLQSLHQSVAQSTTTLDKKTHSLHEVTKMQAQNIVGIQEKFEALEAEFRRIRNVTRRESVQNSTTTATLAQLSVELMDVANTLKRQSASVDTHETLLHGIVHNELPALTQSVQQTMLELRSESDFKTRALAKELATTSERLRSTQQTMHHQLESHVSDSLEALYRDLMVITSAQLVGVEMAARQNAAVTSLAVSGNNNKATGALSSPMKKTKHKTPLDVGVALLLSVVATFQGDCKKTVAQPQHGENEANGDDDDDGDDESAKAIASVLLDKLEIFRLDLEKLKEQADKADKSIPTTTAATATPGSAAADTDSSKTRAFQDHLVLLCTNQLRSLEELLVTQSSRSNSTTMTTTTTATSSVSRVVAHVKDLVIQLRAVLFLLVLHTQLVEPPRQIHTLAVSHATAQSTLTAHAFALSQLATVEAVVKLMNTRLDGFAESTLAFARDDDVKKSIQELLQTSDAIRDTLATQVDSTHSDAVQRDELLERELLQLAGRVQKKLDKDEMLWTQEVLERQLQGVAKNALGEQDLVDIQRALRAKMDKTQFHALLQQQHAKLLESGALHANGGSGGASGNQPSGTTTHCISCNNELPPSPSQLRATVQEEVRHQVAKALAAATKHSPSPVAPSSPSSSSSSFQASNHRSLDKHKKELLLAALQQKK